MAGPHETVPVSIMVEVDKRVAPLVSILQQYDGIRTVSSCEDVTPRGDGIAEVMIEWHERAAIVRLSSALTSWNDAWTGVEPHPRAVLDRYNPSESGASFAYLRVETELVQHLADRLRKAIDDEAFEVVQTAQRAADAAQRITSDEPTAPPASLLEHPGA